MTDRLVYDDPAGTTPLNADPADTDPLYVDGSYGDLALAPTLSGSGFLLVSGSSAVTFAPSLSGSGTVSGAAAAASGGPALIAVINDRRLQQLVGRGSVALALGVNASGYVNDDDLVLLLAA